MLYVAYGSNLNVQQMSYRCPRATVAFTGYLINWKLLYRGSRTGSYATVKRQKGSRVPVAVWNIDNKNEKALDLYEGYPRFYRKKNVFVQLKNGTRKKAMIYLLPDSATVGKPSNRYVETVLQGYKDMGFDTDYLYDSLEYNLKEMYKSPNGTIRAILDGTVFRAPIVVKGIEPTVKTWKKPITIARHAYGDVYKASEVKIPGKGKAEIVYTAEDGTETRELIHEFDGPGIVQGMHNLNGSIDSFARSCFNYALETHQDLWFATKDTISKKYDHTFKDIFQDIYDADYKEKFEEAGIEYFYTLIDDAVARVIRSEGGYIWACKNYDGDVMSDMVATAFGSLAMMTSVLVAPDGTTEYEAAHGTVQRHYYKHLKGEETSTNSVATIFAWSGALRKRGKLDGIDELVTFADKLEKATIDTIESGTMTKDLALITTLENVNTVNSEDFIKAIRATLENLLNA